MAALRGFPTKLTAGFTLVLLTLGGSAILSFNHLAQTLEARDLVVRGYLDDLLFAERIRADEDRTVAASRGYLITKNPEFLRRVDEAERALNDTLRDLPSRVRSPEGRELLGKSTRAVVEYERAQRRLLSAGATSDVDEIARQFEKEVVPLRRRLDEAVDILSAYKQQRLESAHDETRAVTTRATAIGATALSLAVILSALLAWAIGKDLTKAYRREQDAVKLAERALAARQEVLGVIAHDLRSPLASITLRAGLLHKTAGEEKTREQADALARVAGRMEALVRSLLDASSIELGHLSIRLDPCKVDDVLREASDVLRVLSSPKSIELTQRIGEPELHMHADRDRILQVLTNLVGNSIKFTPDAGKIELSAEADGDFVRFAVRDSGPGIAPEIVPHVFDRFWKAESGGGKLGTGLGLYISKGIVDAHGGRIWVESRLSAGTTFYFTIPRL